MRFLTRSHVGSSEMEQRELWLTQLSDDELMGLSPWDILLTKNAQRFLLSVGRSVLREFSYHGLTRMSKDELLHEMYTDLADEIPGILEQCVRKANADQRDQYIFGSLQNVIRWRLTNFVFGTNRPRELISLEDIKAFSDYGTVPRHHELMHPSAIEANEFLEARGSHEPSFLSESQFIEDPEVQRRHALIEGVRPYLTSREAVVLRQILLLHNDRSLVALEVGVTPKQVSRYRASIQRKLQEILLDLGWEESEIEGLSGRLRVANNDCDEATAAHG